MGDEYGTPLDEDDCAGGRGGPMTADDWRAAWERELAARQDAEARLSGMRWAVGAVVVAVVAVSGLMGCLSASNEASRAVARWEVSDGE